MELELLLYFQKLTCFLDSYINYEKEDYTPSGVLTYTAIVIGVKLLIEKEVFLSITDMRKAAIKEYNIILPEWVFEKVKER